MRIERIELDGFGRFHAAHWPLDAGMTVLVGANEAGKTTLLNGLRALLFGFEPTRDGRTWYPAFAGGRRGGRLVLRTASNERWTVERFGERGGAGSLAVRAPNGNQGGQETLDRLLRGADRDLFNNIFAFGLGELQSLSSLNADGVRGRIYGAGAGLGGTSAVDLERRLRQEMDASFLPRGSQKPLNVLLGRIDELRGEIGDLAQQPEEHATAHRDRDALRARADALRDEIRERRERALRCGRLIEAVPIVAELGVVRAELAAGDAALDTFPEDAAVILDRRLSERGEASATLAAIDEQLLEARGSLRRTDVDEQVLGRAEEISALVTERASRTAADGQRRGLETSEARHDAAVAEQLARVGGWTEARLVALDDSIPAVEATRTHGRDLDTTRSAASEAEQRRRLAEHELELREREGVRETDEVDLASRARVLRDLDDLRLRRAAAVAVAGGSAIGFARSPAVSYGLAGALLVIGLVIGSLVAATLVGAVLGAVAGALLLLLARRSGMTGEDVTTLDVERAGLLSELGLEPATSDDALRAAADDLAATRAQRELVRDQRSRLEARRAELVRLTQLVEAASAAAVTAAGAWAGWLTSQGLPVDTPPEAARQVLGAAGTAHRAAAERDGDRARLAELAAEDATYHERADALLVALGSEPARDVVHRDALVLSLASRLERARDARRRANELDAAIARLLDRRTPSARLVAERERAIGEYLESVGCGDADELRRNASQASARRDLQARAREIGARLAGIAGGAEASEALASEASATDPAALEAALVEAQEDLARLERDEHEAISQIGASDAHIRSLEAAEDVGAKRQELVMLKGQAAAMAREWSVRAVALRLLEATRARYERDRQPDVVRAAESHLEMITGGRYARIVAPPGEASVRVEMEGGESRVTDELSRGTAEQLYLALRFGLIEEFARHAEPLPVVMDDILVNFDPDRAARAASSIRDLATRHQLLYFTCHPWTAQLLDPGGSRTLTLE